MLKVALNECGYLYVYLDPRFSTAPDYRDFAYLVKRSLDDFLSRCRGLDDRVVDMIKRVRGVNVSVPGFDVEISWGRKNKLDLPNLFEALDKLGESLGKPVVIAIDEAQELRKITWVSFDRFFAYAYDNLRNLRFVLTGSEVGLLYRFLRIDDSTAPLYGRYIHVVRTRRLTYSEALEFLKKGLEEVGIEVPEDILSRAVEAIDGIIG